MRGVEAIEKAVQVAALRAAAQELVRQADELEGLEATAVDVGGTRLNVTGRPMPFKGVKLRKAGRAKYGSVRRLIEQSLASGRWVPASELKDSIQTLTGCSSGAASAKVSNWYDRHRDRFERERDEEGFVYRLARKDTR